MMWVKVSFNLEGSQGVIAPYLSRRAQKGAWVTYDLLTLRSGDLAIRCAHKSR